jgi:hypothetical protein
MEKIKAPVPAGSLIAHVGNRSETRCCDLLPQQIDLQEYLQILHEMQSERHRLIDETMSSFPWTE